MKPRVWVTGARGMLGVALMDALQALDKESPIVCQGTGREVDIADEVRVAQYAKEFGPTHIINCAAFTDVDGAETHESEALRINGVGPGVLAALGQRTGAICLHVSTDYVFAGDADTPYEIDAATGPVGAYGRTKLTGEQSFQNNLGPNGAGRIVRTSWLFGPGGKNFVATMVALFRAHPTVRVVKDQRGRPTYAPDLAQALLHLAGLTQGHVAPQKFGMTHFANAGETTWFGLASATHRRMQDRGEKLVCAELVPVTSQEFVRPAFRPGYSVLSTSEYTRVTTHIPRPFEEALAEYLAKPQLSPLLKESSCAG